MAFFTQIAFILLNQAVFSSPENTWEFFAEIKLIIDVTTILQIDLWHLIQCISCHILV